MMLWKLKTLRTSHSQIIKAAVLACLSFMGNTAAYAHFEGSGGVFCRPFIASDGGMNNFSLSHVRIVGNRVDIYDDLYDPTAFYDTSMVALRYNIDALPYLWEPAGDAGAVGGDVLSLGVRFKDRGRHSRIRIHLKERNLITGEAETVGSWDSDDYSASSAMQYVEKEHFATHQFDFNNNLYWMDALLIANSKVETVGLALDGFNLCWLTHTHVGNRG